MEIPDCFYRVSVKAIVREETGKMLMVRERSDTWDLPGGGVDHADTNLRSALERELQEELGVSADKIAEIPTFVLKAKHTKNPCLLIGYEVTLGSAPLTLGDDIEEMDWISLDTFDTLPVDPAIASVRTELQTLLSQK